MAKTQKTTAQEWAARVERWQRSGLSAPEIGRREGFDGRQLTYWKWRLGQKSKRATPKKAARKQGKPKRARAKAAGFVPVKLPTTAAAPALEIMLSNGRTVRVPSGCDGTWLAEVLAAADGV
jgi:transposase